MSGSYSPYTRSGYSDEHSYYNSPSPTPSPRPSSYMYGQPQYPQRPATRAHFRTPSHHRPEHRPETVRPPTSSHPPAASPRFTSDGQYATKSTNVSARHSSPLYSPSTPPSGGRHSRRSSVSEARASPGVQRVVEFDGVYYIVGSEPKASRRSVGGGTSHSSLRHATDHPDWQHSGYAGYSYGRDELPGSQTPRPGHSRRRSSMSVPQRPSTTRPSATQQQQAHARAQAQAQAQAQAEAKAGAIPRPATEADRALHRIPKGFSMKNWDPSEAPILLLGSVFHADSLGKWVYDWTVYHHGAKSETTGLAADLWILLIEFNGKMRAADAVCKSIRSRDARNLVEDYMDSGDRITDLLRDLLKRCEAPMMQAKRNGQALGKNSGVEFVETLFGADRELPRTEILVAKLNKWLKRFEVNCDPIVQNPTR